MRHSEQRGSGRPQVKQIVPAEAAGLRMLKVLEMEVVLSLSAMDRSDVASVMSFAGCGGRRAGLDWQFVQRKVV